MLQSHYKTGIANSMMAKYQPIRMKMITSSFHLGFLILCISIFVANCCYVETGLPRRKHAPLFVFGASQFDVGNNNYINTTTSSQANFWPYGETFFKYPSGRFSNGRLIPDFIAEYAKLPLTLPYLYPGCQGYVDGVNFASAGAGALAEVHKGLVIDLNTQLANFKKVQIILKQRIGVAETRKLLSNAVYLFNIGANDYNAFLFENSSVLLSYSIEDYVKMVVGNLTAVITEIHKKGGRKFGIVGLAPLGCLPSARARANASAGSCIEEASALARQNNNALSEALRKLEKQFEGFKYSYTDYYALVAELINHPSKYGFKEGHVACCGSGPYRGYFTCGGKRGVEKYELCENPNEYVFFDSGHPSERANQFFAQQMWSGSSHVTGPYNLKMLFED